MPGVLEPLSVGEVAGDVAGDAVFLLPGFLVGDGLS